MDKLMLVKFWGVHGSLPRPGPTTLKYGGNTACVEVRCGNTLIVFDAGTGIRDLGEDLCERHRNSDGKHTRINGHIFFSHLHWDHIQGFPFFAPAYMDGNEFHLYAGRELNHSFEKLMRNQMAEPNFPVALDKLSASIAFHDLKSGDMVRLDDVIVRCQELSHPGGSLGYRIESEGKSLVYATDTELVDGLFKTVPDFAANADVLIYDSMFTPEQYSGAADNCCRRAWGHSTWEGAVQVANAAGVGHLILFHHGNQDTLVDEIQEKAREKFPRTTAAYEGLEIEL
jgi:phosphoribosyl 1,2-cyclic phosphodiesterase